MWDEGEGMGEVGRGSLFQVGAELEVMYGNSESG